MISKIILGLFSIVVLFQVNSVYGLEELPVITIEFTSGDIIDLDKSPQMIRAYIQIQNYDPQHGYHFMEISRLSDGEIIKTTEIFPRVVDDHLFDVQILHYLEPDDTETNIIGDYVMRVFSESGPTDAVSTFSLIQSSNPVVITQNIKESGPSEIESEVGIESLQIETSEQSKIPAWVHDVFVWYAEDTISENDLLSAIEYLISEEIINIG